MGTCFLVEGYGHQYKKFYKFFDNMPKLYSTLVKQDRYYTFETVKAIQVTYRKKRNSDKAPIDGVPFKKQSILYTSPCRIG